MRGQLRAVALLLALAGQARALGGDMSQGIGTTLPMYMTQSGDINATASQNRIALQQNLTVGSVASGGVPTGWYTLVTTTATDNNIGGAAHIVGGVFRITEDTTTAKTTLIALEGRIDPRSTNTGTGYENSAVYGYISGGFPSGAALDNVYIGLDARVCITSADDCGGSALSTATVKAVRIRNILGGAASNNHALYQEGSDDINYFAGKIGQGATDPAANIQSSAEDPLLWAVDASAVSIGSLGADNTGAKIGAYSNHPVDFIQNNTAMVRITTNGGHRIRVRTLAQIHAITPTDAGEEFLCSNCARAYDVCVATGTAVDQFRVQSGTTGCQ